MRKSENLLSVCL